MFKKRRGIHIPYNKQGLIYFTCMNIKDMPEVVQQKVLNLCVEVGKKNKSADCVTHSYGSCLGQLTS